MQLIAFLLCRVARYQFLQNTFQELQNIRHNEVEKCKSLLSEYRIILIAAGGIKVGGIFGEAINE